MEINGDRCCTRSYGIDPTIDNREGRGFPGAEKRIE
jgi:hypothetical protein